MNNHDNCMSEATFKKNLTSRINRIEGQLRGIERMILNHSSCDDILNQISSIKSALNGVAKVVLEEHLKNCVVTEVKSGLEDIAVAELIETLNDFMYKSTKTATKDIEVIIKRTEKQISSIKKSIEKNECCSKFLKTISAIKNELDIISKNILENHVKNCLVADIKAGYQDNVIDDFLYTVNKMMK